MVSQWRRPLCWRVLLVVAAAAAVVAAAVKVEGDASPGVLDELRAEGQGLGKVRIGLGSFPGISPLK